jgi:apolipoprotein D and lipocalin family protein
MHLRAISSWTSIAGALVAVMTLAPTVQARTHAPLPVAADFDAKAFCGSWYEVARTRSSLALRALSSTDGTASFAIAPDDETALLGTFASLHLGQHTSVSGRLEAIDDAAPARMSFSYSLPPYTSTEMSVLAVAEDYSFALVGEASRRNAYVYSRTPSINPDVLRELVARLGEDYGYVNAERTMQCTQHNGEFVPGCDGVLN